RAASRNSLLAEPQPMSEWVALRPARFGAPRFDSSRQTVAWPLFDANDAGIDLQIAFSDMSAHAIERIERFNEHSIVAGTLVIARVRGTADRLLAEPLSLVVPTADAAANCIDCLYFDAPAEDGLVAGVVRKFRKLVARAPSEVAAKLDSPST